MYSLALPTVSTLGGLLVGISFSPCFITTSLKEAVFARCWTEVHVHTYLALSYLKPSPPFLLQWPREEKSRALNNKPASLFSSPLHQSPISSSSATWYPCWEVAMWINAVSQAVHQKGANGFLHMVWSKGSPNATGIQAPTSACVGEDLRIAKRPPCLLVAQARP